MRDPMVKCERKNVLILIFATTIEMGALVCFLSKKNTSKFVGVKLFLVLTQFQEEENFGL